MTSKKQKAILAIAAIAVVCAIVFLLLRRHEPPAQAVVPKPKAMGEVFSSLSSSNTYLKTSGWAVGLNAHAESFVPSASGAFSMMEAAIEPSYNRVGREKTAGDLDIYLARDEGGFPGAVLERFSIPADPPSSPPPFVPLAIETVTRPQLEAGVKYWLCAGCPGPGSWMWRFNDRNLMQISARELKPGVWQSAGNGRNGAFRVYVTSEK